MSLKEKMSVKSATKNLNNMSTLISIKGAAAVLAFSLLSLRANAQEIPVTPDKEGSYCAVLKDGIMVLMRNGTLADGTVTLNDGSQVTKDATVLRRDGSKVILKEGDCVDINGNVQNTGLESKPPKQKK
jgi:hypothetical protein